MQGPRWRPRGGIRLAAMAAGLAMLAAAFVPTGAPAVAAPATSTLTFAAPTPTPTPSTLAARAALAQTIGPGAIVESERPLGALRWVANLDGTLSGPSAAAPADVALGFVHHHLDAFGLTANDLTLLHLRNDYTDILGTHHLSWVERVNGIPFFGAGLKAAVEPDGSLLSLAGPIYHIVRPAGAARPRLSARDAVDAALRAEGDARGRVDAPRGFDRARPVRYASPAGIGMAWDTLTYVSPQRIVRSVVDGASGRVLWRENLVRADQSGSGLAWPEAPGPFPNGGGDQVPVTFPVQGPAALSGNNAHVYTAVTGATQIVPANDVPALNASTLSWGQAPVFNTHATPQNCSATFPCTWDFRTPYSWQTNRRQEAVQAYYLLNVYHDHLAAAPIGFTEAAGNFQVQNTGGAGRGGDPVLAATLVGANLGRDGRPRLLNNASMYTPPDGTSPQMQLFLFRRDPTHPTGPTADAADDATVVFHEYTHGLSGRLVTMPDGSEALYGAQSSAMSEGWSDWYALDELVAQGYQADTPRADVPVGEWISGGPGVRPQFADCLPSSRGAGCAAPAGGTAGPGGFTLGDFGRIAGKPDVHDDGEIWLQTLWQLRTALGSKVTEALVTRAMELSPQAPTFLEERDAILLADEGAFGGAHHTTIWRTFARRGMGWLATTRTTFGLHPVEDFSMPATCPDDRCGRVSGQVTDPTTGRPVPGALVHIDADERGAPIDLSAVTAANGTFTIANVPNGTYRDVAVSAPGYPVLALGPVAVQGVTHLHATIRRDWASLTGGARIEGVTGPDRTTTLGACGPRGALDGSLGTSWLTSVAQPRLLTIRLPSVVNVTGFGVDPSATCAGPSSDTRAFRIWTRTAHGRWQLAYGTVSGLPRGRITTVRPTAGAHNVRFVRLVLLSATRSKRQVEFTELIVHGTAAAAGR